MHLTIAYFKIKKRNLVLINNATYQRETLSERPIRPPLNAGAGLTSVSSSIVTAATAATEKYASALNKVDAYIKFNLICCSFNN